MTAPNPRSILLDTNCFIYLLERPDEPAGRYVERVVRDAMQGGSKLLTSSVCLSEFLVGVARSGPPSEVQRVLSSFLSLPALEVVPVTNDIATAAAVLRGRSTIRLFDALVVATGEIAGADEFLTNDAALARTVTGLRTVYLNDVAV